MDEIFKLLNPDNTVTLNRPLAHALGTNEAIVYSALIAKYSYYGQHEMLDADGYFYSTIADLQESTGLTRYQQDGAIKNLTEIGLIECCKKGIPARRFFRVNDNAELLGQFLKKGEEIMRSLNPLAQKNSRQACGKPANLPAENLQTCEGKTDKHTYNPKKKSKEKNPHQSIIRDGIDVMDFPSTVSSSVERAKYLELIRKNIDYDCFIEKEKVDELVGIMLDVVCSTKDTIRVNGEDLPHEVVKSRFLKLKYEHIDYVLTSLKKNTSDVRNIRAYLITALYNSFDTIDSYYTAWVNHDMRGGV